MAGANHDRPLGAELTLSGSATRFLLPGFHAIPLTCTFGTQKATLVQGRVAASHKTREGGTYDIRSRFFRRVAIKADRVLIGSALS